VSRAEPLRTNRQLLPRRLVNDRRFYRLIYLFGREEHGRLHTGCTGRHHRQRNGGCSQVLRQVKDYMNVIFPEDEIERIYAPTQTFNHFLHRSPACCSTPFYKALCSLCGVGGFDQILRHSSPPEKTTCIARWH